MLTKVTRVDRIEVLEDGSVQVRRATHIEEDGVRITEPTYHRSAYTPGAEVAHEHARVKAITDVVWTKDVVDAAIEKQGRG